LKSFLLFCDCVCRRTLCTQSFLLTYTFQASSDRRRTSVSTAVHHRRRKLLSARRRNG
jgi:hypothetical protein